jgi:lipopolysaccharide biosynthesis protein
MLRQKERNQSPPSWMTNSSNLAFVFAKTSPKLARLVTFLRAALRHPTSSRKRRAFYERVTADYDDELRFERWIRPNTHPPKDCCVSFPPNASFKQAPSDHALQMAVVCHIYYIDTAEHIGHYLKNIPTHFDLLISTDTLDKARFIEDALSSCGASRIIVRILPNIGRDIAPKLLGFPDLLPLYDLLLFIHGKKSEFASELGGWREHLYKSILGSPDLVANIINSFADVENLGMVSPQHYRALKGNINWGKNKRIAHSLCAKLLNDKWLLNYLDFPSGSMFWCRPGALQPLLDLKILLSEFPPESGQLDGTLSHAIERLFFISCEIAGFRWLKTAQNGSPILPSEIVEIQSTSRLEVFLRDAYNPILAKRVMKLKSK